MTIFVTHDAKVMNKAPVSISPDGMTPLQRCKCDATLFMGKSAESLMVSMGSLQKVS